MEDGTGQSCDLAGRYLHRIAAVLPPAIENGADVCFCMEKEVGKLCIAEMYATLCYFIDENNNLEIAWRDFWALACHSIWKWRNKEKHEISFVRPTHPAQHVKMSALHYEMAVRMTSCVDKKPSQVVHIKWNVLNIGGLLLIQTDHVEMMAGLVMVEF
ncbi:very-long-chain 3-oxoacyl-CoA synthase [Trifolium repens]|nr:very-long-chain 3-oxoacyl-CoA synthase [Trifolium repens]